MSLIALAFSKCQFRQPVLAIVAEEMRKQNVLCVWVAAVRPSQQFFSHVGTFSLVEPVLSNEDEVSCSRSRHCAPGEIPTHDQLWNSTN